MSKKKKNIDELLNEALVLEEEQPYKIPENWVWVKFDSVIKISSNRATSVKQKDYEEVGIPVIDQGRKLISGFTNKQESVYTGELPVIIFGDHTKCLKWVDFEFAQGADGTKILKPLEHLYPKYFYYLLNVVNLPDKGYSRHYKYLRDVVLPIPPIHEQKVISEKVEHFLNKIEEAQQLIEEAKETLELNKRHIIDATFLGMFSLNKRDRTQDYYGFIWGQKNLSDICEIRGGIQKTPKRKPIRDFYPYLRVANVYRDCLKLDEIEYFELTDVELEKWKLEPQDLLIIEGNGSIKEIGRSAIWNGEIENCVHQNHIIRCRPKDNVDSSFISLFLNSTFGRKQMMEKASSSSGLHTLSVKKLSSISIPLPSLNEQKCLVQKVNKLVYKVDQSLNEVDNVNKIIQGLKQSILSKAFKGELCTSDPNDEPAIELLKSILQ
ncbi:hypothetical protein CN391_25815 [Bacillus anthracis]|nr:hypothetical protein CN391_25815 [Bacillus anthracis]